jgi:hypothetical protein
MRPPSKAASFPSLENLARKHHNVRFWHLADKSAAPEAFDPKRTLRRTSYSLDSQTLCPPLGMPEGGRNARRDHGCDQRFRPLRWKVRWMREDITDERRESAGATELVVRSICANRATLTAAPTIPQTEARRACSRLNAAAKSPRAITRKQASQAPTNFSAAVRTSPPARKPSNARILDLRLDMSSSLLFWRNTSICDIQPRRAMNSRITRDQFGVTSDYPVSFGLRPETRPLLTQRRHGRCANLLSALSDKWRPNLIEECVTDVRYGTKRTWKCCGRMSTIEGKADIAISRLHVR